MDDEFRAPKHLVGATGNFPEGKVNENDLGELQIGIKAFPEHGIVSIDFGKNVEWIGLEKEKAIAFGSGIIEAAGQLK